MILPGLVTLWRGTMVALGVAAAIPARAGDVRSHANPSASFADAVTRARTAVATRDADAADGGATILLLHSTRTPRAVVLLHGFSDSPRQFASLADTLFAAGDNVIVPRLPHHALRNGDARSLAAITPSELCRLADETIDIAAGLGDSVIVVGLSLGGTLAAWSAEHRPEVRRAIVIAPAFQPQHVPSLFERPLVNLGAHLPSVWRRQRADSLRPDRDPGFATHGLAAVLRLGMTVRADAQSRPPRGDVIFLVNEHDRTVQPGPVYELAGVWHRLGAPVSVYALPDSLGLPHNIIDPIGAAGSTLVKPLLAGLARGEEAPRWVGRR